MLPRPPISTLFPYTTLFRSSSRRSSRRRRRRRPVALSATSARAAVKADINVTPLIDVMLVLLIIFMIIPPLIAAGFQATIPRSQHTKSRTQGSDEIRLGIDKDGKYWL